MNVLANQKKNWCKLSLQKTYKEKKCPVQQLSVSSYMQKESKTYLQTIKIKKLFWLISIHSDSNLACKNQQKSTELH